MTLHERLAAELRRRILAGELTVGAALPSEARLCEEFSASRGTVRHALATLRAEGLIGGGRGVPPVVRSRQLSQSFDTFLSFTRWAREIGREPGQRTIEVTRRPASVEAADALGIDEGESVVQLLRLRLLDGEPAMLERSAFPLEVGMPLLTADLDTASIYDTLLAAGTNPSAAHHVFDAVAADDVDSTLLGVAPGSPLLRERRHARDAHGDTVEYGEDKYRSDLITFTVMNAQAAQPALTRTWSSDARHADA